MVAGVGRLKVSKVRLAKHLSTEMKTEFQKVYTTLNLGGNKTKSIVCISQQIHYSHKSKILKLYILYLTPLVEVLLYLAANR